MYPFCDGVVFFVDWSLLMGASFIEMAPFFSVLYSIRNSQPNKIRQTPYIVVRPFGQIIKVLASLVTFSICINTESHKSREN
jgi:hypothetical protein